VNTDELDIWCRIAQQRGGLGERNATVTARTSREQVAHQRQHRRLVGELGDKPMRSDARKRLEGVCPCDSPNCSDAARKATNQGAALTDDERETLGDWWEDETTVSIESAYPVVERIVAAARADERERIARDIEADAVLRDKNSQWRDGMEDAARIAREGGGDA